MRATARLSTKLERNVAAYITVAAGAGMMTLSQAVQAKVVYTATRQVIKTNDQYDLDLNHDGITDFALRNYYATGSSCTLWAILFARPAIDNGVAGFRSRFGWDWASALQRGDQVGSALKFQHYGLMAARSASAACSTRKLGSWLNVKRRYLGLSFQFDGEKHYGWARLSVLVQDFSITGTLTGYAYETIPDKPIIAGNRGRTIGARGPNVSAEPVSLGHLALGAAGRKHPSGAYSH